MSEWDKDEIKLIDETDDLHISPFRADGITYGTPTWIWSVVFNDELFVRAYNGINSSWYKSAIKQKAGRIIAAGMTKEIMFELVEGDINDRIDEAYKIKYKGSLSLNSMISIRSRSATLKLLLKYICEINIWKGIINAACYSKTLAGKIRTAENRTG